MSGKLSPVMVKALAKINATGGLAIPKPGGYWWGADGSRLDIEPEPGSVKGWVGTQTIYALEERGKLRRKNADIRRWRDVYEVVACQPSCVGETGRKSCIS